jgi:hypothetical protein
MARTVGVHRLILGKSIDITGELLVRSYGDRSHKHTRMRS